MLNLAVQNKNVYEFVDYEKPITFIQNDYHTSSSRGHNYYNAPAILVPKQKINSCKVLKNKEPAYEYVTEKSDQYQWKLPLTVALRANRAMTSNRPQYAVTIQNRLKKSPPKPIEQYNTLTHIDINRKFPYSEEKTTFDIESKPPAKPDVCIYSNTKGFSKYLDIYMTTNMQDHCNFPVEQQNGIARKDNLTIWDWFEYPKTNKGFGLKEYPMKKKGKIEPIYDVIQFKNPIHNRITPNSRKFVPNFGLTSEMRSNYTVPIPTTFELDRKPNQPLTIPPTGVKTGTTEYNIYGSGNKTHTFVDSRGSCPDL